MADSKPTPPSFEEMMQTVEAAAAERVTLTCTCGWSRTVPQQARWHIHELHCGAHHRGRDGLAAAGFSISAAPAGDQA